MKHAIAISILFIISACGGYDENNTAPLTINKTTKITSSPAGTYHGVLPCADCPGMDTRLQLNADNTYLLTEQYLEKSKPQTTAGRWFVTRTNMVTLSDSNSTYQRFFKWKSPHLTETNNRGEWIDTTVNFTLTLIK